jgi:geranylgeranyl pyrophosphate synthase
VGVEAVCSVANLQARVEALLTQAYPNPILASKVREALAQPGQVLASEKPGRKLRLVALVYTCLGGVADARLLDVAVAIELLIAAFDVIDDVQDGNLSNGLNRIEVGQWLNVALFLLHTGQYTLNTCGFDSQVLVKAQARFNQLVLASGNGQTADLAYETQLIDTQAALEATTAKSGALFQAIFELCAILGGVAPSVVEWAGKAGQLLGTAKQLYNDLSDVDPQGFAGATEATADLTALRNSDIGRRKKTLPVTFALNRAQHQVSPASTLLLDYYTRDTEPSLDLASYRLLSEAIWDSGAPAYTEAVVEMHRVQAEVLLEAIKAAGYPEALVLLGLLSK